MESTQRYTRTDVSNRFNIPANRFKVKDEVREALARGHPVVALESTIITHGMEYPVNRDTAVAVEQIVRQNGAIPATIAIINGVINIGLELSEIEYLSKEGKTKSRKCSRRDLAFVLAQNGNGSTTVAATMYLANLAGIKIFVTGGIGGVHRGAESTFDISADLTELSRTPVSVICAGVKSILDIPKTLEFLETMGVPVVSYRTEWFPDFFTTNSGIKSVFRADSPEECAGIILGNDILKLKNGIIFAVPVPSDKEANQENIQSAITQALKETDEKGVKGALITPFLLKRVNELTGGESSASNVELIKNNAKLGAEIAVSLAQKLAEESKSAENHQSIVSTTKISIVGGAAVDIIAKSDSLENKSGQSHVGTIRIQEGGSARNIAECVGRLGLGKDCTFISAVGEDSEKSDIIFNSLRRVNLSTSGIQVKKGARTAAFSAMINQKGEFLQGVADMDVLSTISKDHLDKFNLKASKILLIDSNISEETLFFILSDSSKVQHVIYEPISKEKSTRILYKDCLSKITLLKPNLHQLIDLASAFNPAKFSTFSPMISNFDAENQSVVKEMINELFSSAAKQSQSSRLSAIVVTLGKFGVIVGQQSSFKHYPALKIDEAEIKSAVGSGDSFMGGFIHGLYHGLDLDNSVMQGQICSIQSLKSERNISETITAKLFE